MTNRRGTFIAWIAYSRRGQLFGKAFDLSLHTISSSRRILTPLRYILREPPLKWAFRLMLLGVLLFIVFRGRRWQRPVPVVAAPVNAILDFVRTVGRLYFQHADHSALVDRKLRYFFDRNRSRQGLTDVDLSEETERRVATRTSLSNEHVAGLFARFRRLHRSRSVKPEQLVELDRSLDRFYEAVGR